MKSPSSPVELAHGIADAVCALAPGKTRRFIALAGPPGVGKTTVSSLVREELTRRGTVTGLLAMDGFHYDNAILDAQGMRHRKGAPETFDVAGLRSMLQRLRTEAEVAVPEFDRTSDQAIAAKSLVTEDQQTVLVEGNYLLLDAPNWSDLKEFWSLSVLLDAPIADLEARLTDRWLQYGLDPEEARTRALSNDIPNARTVLENSPNYDLLLR